MQEDTREPVIAVNHVDLVFRENAGVFDLTFSVPPATILGLIGPSGCGKTTTIRLLTGVYRPMRGEVKVLGRVPAKFSPSDRERIGYIPQHFVLYPNLTVAENISFVASLYGLDAPRRARRLDELLDFVDLAEARDQLGQVLSGGMQRRVMLAGALMHEPWVLFADEPTAGIDPVLRRRFWDYFRHIRDEGRTVLVTTQYVGEAAYCDLVAIMRGGRVLMVDTPERLRRRALGGEVIELEVDASRRWEAMHAMSQHADVRHIEPVEGQPSRIHVIVKDAGKTLPALIEMLQQANDIRVFHAERFLPPFDDVFVKLMEQAEPGPEGEVL